MVIAEMEDGSLVVTYPDHNACVVIEWKGPMHPLRLTATVIDDLEKFAEQATGKEATKA
jgi:hypothetical protein